MAGLDDGYYGRGMYFTSDLRYANMYAEIQAKKAKPTGPWGANVFLIAAVLPGNPYPVTEHPFIPQKDKDGKLLSPAQFEMDPTLEGKDKRKRNPFGLLGQPARRDTSRTTLWLTVSIPPPPFPLSMVTLMTRERLGLCRTSLWCLRVPRPFPSS